MNRWGALICCAAIFAALAPSASAQTWREPVAISQPTAFIGQPQLGFDSRDFGLAGWTANAGKATFADPTSGPSPCGAAASSTCCQTTPAPIRARRFAASMLSSSSLAVCTSSTSSRSTGTAPWPVRWGSTRSPFSLAKRTVSATSFAFAAATTAAGCIGTATFQGVASS